VATGAMALMPPASRSAAAAHSQRPHTSPYQLELGFDPQGIGFAYGGVAPGRKGLAGKPVETHAVSFSVGVVGTYLLHVKLRAPHAAGVSPSSLALPGSPFLLEVRPGGAHPMSTRIPARALPLRGTPERRATADGVLDGIGCSLRLRACDKMGNLCESGGAQVSCSALSAATNETADDVECSARDEGNGWYVFSWWAGTSGRRRAVVKMNGLHVVGSPCAMLLDVGKPAAASAAERGGGSTGGGGAASPPRAEAAASSATSGAAPEGRRRRGGVGAVFFPPGSS
jgi:hypothetical protein